MIPEGICYMVITTFVQVEIDIGDYLARWLIVQSYLYQDGNCSQIYLPNPITA